MKTLLYQDDVTPEGMEAFDKAFLQLMSITRKYFMSVAVNIQRNNGWTNHWRIGKYILERHIDDCCYKLSIEE